MDIFLLTTPPSLSPRSPLSLHNRKSKINHESPTIVKFTPLKSKKLNTTKPEEEEKQHHHLSISEKINKAKIRRHNLISNQINNTQKRTRKKHCLANQRASLHRQSKITRARLDINRSKSIAKRVKAARAIQRFVRLKLIGNRLRRGENDDDGNSMAKKRPLMGQKDASKRLQKWHEWRLAVSHRRWCHGHCHTELNKILKEMDDTAGEESSFDDLSRLMTRRDVIEWATTVVEALLPLQYHNFGSSKTKRARCLLSSFMIARHADVVLEFNGDDDDDDDDDDDCSDDKRRHACTLVKKAAVALLQSLKELTRGDNNDVQVVVDTASLRVVSKRVMQFEVLFDEWKKQDLELLVNKLMREAEETWTIYLAMGGGSGSSTSDDCRDEDSSKMECREGAKEHLKRLRRSLNRIVGTTRGKNVMMTAKAKAKDKLESEEENRNTTLCVIVI